MRITKRQSIADKAADVLFRSRILVPLAVALLLQTTAFADTWYVKPSAEVPIRSGQGTEYKILSVVPDGLQVEIIQEEDPWAKVRTAGGTEGWMLKRYLSSDPPLTDLVASLKNKSARLEEGGRELDSKFNELSAVHIQTEQELNACITERAEIQKTYEILRADTADVMKIKNSLTQAEKELQTANQQLAVMAEKNKNMKRNTSVMWFLAGGFVLILGWMIGMMTGRAKRRKSSLY